MYTGNDSHRQPTIYNVKEAESEYFDDSSHEQKLIQIFAKELYLQKAEQRTHDVTTIYEEEDDWGYLLNAREKKVFLGYSAIKHGICELENLHLDTFRDQDVAVAIELLLTENERAIRLSPLANRVRRMQLVFLRKGYWDVLGLTLGEREERLDLLTWT